MQKRILVFLLVGALMAACSTASAPPDPTPTAAPSSDLSPTSSPEPTLTPTLVFSSDPYKDGMVARRNGDYARAVAAFQFTLKSNPAPDLTQEAQYRLGEAYWLKNDDAKAVAALNAYLQANANGAHAPEAHYLLADAYRVLKDYPNALEQLRIYRGITSMLVGDTDATIADVMVLAGDSANAIKQYDVALKDTTLSASARINILMRLADVHLGRTEPALAAARYDAALALAGDPRTKADLDLRAGEAYAAANQIDQALARWNDAVAKYPDQPGAYKSLVDLVNRSAAADDYQRGLVDYYAASYDAAIAAFQRYLQNSAPRAGDAHYFIAASYAGKSAYAQAIAEYDTIIKSLPKDKRVPDAYLGKAGALGIIGKIDDAVAVYHKFVAAFPDDAQASEALWRAALLLDRAKRNGDAADLYEELQAKYPTRARADDALFWAGMDYYRSKDFKTATARWQKIVKEYGKSDLLPRALFWLGKVATAQGQNDVAKTYWTQASAGGDYYAWRAKDALAAPKTNVTYDPARYTMDNDADRAEFEKWLASWSKSASTLPPGQLDAATRNDPHFKRGAELLRLDRTVEARREFASIISDNSDDPRALYALALYFRDNNLYSLAIDCGERIARLAANAGAASFGGVSSERSRTAQDAPRLLWMLRYPTYYTDLVVPEAKQNQVDPLLYFALIRQESSFNPWSTSSTDARGLGQVMPPTGQDIARRLGVRNFSLDQLYLPYISIRFGVWYFAQDLKLFDEPIYALAAYNAGTGRVKDWQRPDLDLAVEEISLSETAQYVRIVYSNWRQYQAIYK
ncbi:MAG: tetratricopeptide repeat protein [Chloroflexota bacterium]|nr:tetratricopeptide repeat protein [Chloroflexota bacterium]